MMTMKMPCLIIALLAPVTTFAQQVTPLLETPYDEAAETTDGRDVIFSNLDGSPGNRFDGDPTDAQTVAGKSATGETEKWIAIRFVPRTNAQAKTLMAAIGYESGTKRVNLGIYSDNFGIVGTLIPGGQGTASQIPDDDACCQLTKVTLPEPGVLLTAGTPYWLVASPDNIDGASFVGGWRVSNEGRTASVAPPGAWQDFRSQWPAAEIRGTKLGDQSEGSSAISGGTFLGENAPARNTTIFSNLGTGSLAPYNVFASSLLFGSEVSFQPEIWQAVPFTPKKNSHATKLKAAINWVSGAKKVKLGIYTDNDGNVGTILGEGSTTRIPDSGDCCDLATVNLPGSGVPLAAGAQYWLVASTDDVDAADFEGKWCHSTLALTAYQEPENFINWTSFTGNWLAAEIQGTNP